ncbi:hypothetical protein ACFL6C_03090 [Myxococcota bacterium]
MKERLLGWLGRSADRQETGATGMSVLLEQHGVSGERLSRALQHRHLLRTRLVSTLVEEGVLGEQAALEILATRGGLPGVSLRRSVIDLGLPCLPVGMTSEHLLLPLQKETDGGLILAAADPLPARLQQEIELALGGAVRPHLALHAHLARAIRACQQLGAQCQEAALLLGDEVDAAGIRDSHQFVTKVILETPVPGYPRVDAPSDPQQELSILVASDDPERHGRLDIAGRVMTAADGPAVLRLLLVEQPDLLVLDAQLPARSGVELLKLLGRSTRFAEHDKILVAPAGLQVDVDCLSGIGVETTTVEELPAKVAVAIERLGRRGRSESNDWGQRAEAEYFAGRARLARGESGAAREHLVAAIGINPLLAEAHLELGRLQFAAGESLVAEAELAWARDFGVAGARDLGWLGTLIQQRGDLHAAAAVWQCAAGQEDDARFATALRAHADRLLGRQPAAP